MKNGYIPDEKYPEQPSIPPMPVVAQAERIQVCKYLLPCGICDRNGKTCAVFYRRERVAR